MAITVAEQRTGHGFRRLRLSRPPCRAGAPEARLARPRRGAPPRSRRPPAAARHRRLGPAGAGQSPLSLVGRPRRRRRRRGDQPRRHPRAIRGRQRFDAVHAFGARAVAEATRAAGIEPLVHVSALGADPESPSAYAQQQGRRRGGRSRDAAGCRDLPARRSCSGRRIDFFNRFAGLARFSPVLAADRRRPDALPAGLRRRRRAGHRRRASRARRAGQDLRARRARSEDASANAWSCVLAETDRKRLLLPLPWCSPRVAGAILQYLPVR